MEEYLDVCTEDGQPTGEIIERAAAHREDICHRTAHVWVIRKEEGKIQILMQKRAADKDSFPNRYDTSSAGHIPAGSEPADSAVRELNEELGIAAAAAELRFAGTFRNHYETEFYGKPFRDNEISFVYVYDRPVDTGCLVLQKEEVACVEWFDLEYVREEKRKGNRKFCVASAGLDVLGRFLEETTPQTFTKH